MLEEFISKVQYLIGEYGYKFLCSTNQRYSNADFQKALELSYLLDYLISDDAVNEDEQYIQQLVDFFEARYNFNPVPYITYPNRVTNILYGFGINTGDNTFIFSGVEEAPYNNLLHARINKQWQSFVIPNSYSQAESDSLYYPLSSNPAGYITSASLHNPVTLGITNGLSLSGQELSLALATPSANGAMSALDKTKLDNLSVHDSVTLGTTNGLSLVGQQLSLSLATISAAGAMSSADKIKLDNLTEYVHPTGFTNQPVNPLSGPSVISRVTVNNEGHVTGVTTRDLTKNDLGIVPNTLSRVNDTNVTLTLGGTPVTALLESVSLTLGWTGLLAVTRGGIGVGTLTSGEVLVGNDTSPVSTLSRNGIDTRTSFPPAIHTLTSHSDVNLSTPVTNQVLGFNGTVWTNITLDLNDFTFTELDPIFTAFRDTVRTAKTFYAAPTASNAIASFRTIIADDLPNIYVRFDIPQSLTELEKQRVRTTLGINNLTGNFEPAFSKGDIITDTPTVLSLVNGTSRLVGLSDFIITHEESGWNPKTTLSGANIISNLTIDDYGHIADWTTRELTLDNITSPGYQDSLDNVLSVVSDLEEALYAVNLIKITRPVHKSYDSTDDMVEGQGCNCQLKGFLYFDGTSYWEYLGTTNGDISDYRALVTGGGSVHNELTGLQGGDGTNYYHNGLNVHNALINANSPSDTNYFITVDDLTDAINGITYIPVEENFTYTSGSFEFTLSNTPNTNEHIFVFVNGQSIPDTSYDISGTTLEILETLEVGYTIQIKYKI